MGASIALGVAASRRGDGIDRLKRNRAVATRFGALAVGYETTGTIAAINEWL